MMLGKEIVPKRLKSDKIVINCTSTLPKAIPVAY